MRSCCWYNGEDEDRFRCRCYRDVNVCVAHVISMKLRVNSGRKKKDSRSDVDNDMPMDPGGDGVEH